MEIKGYSLINEEKVERALHGTPSQDGGSVGGIVKVDGTFEDGALLAEYDKLGGLIQKGTDKVKTGSFYDFKAKRALAVPNVVFTFFVNGKFVEVPEGTELPGEVKAVKIIAKEKIEAEVEKKVSKKKK